MRLPPPPEGVAALALNYRADYAEKHFSLLLDKMRFDLEGLVLQGLQAKDAAIKLDRLGLSEGRFDLENRELNIGEVALNGGNVVLQRDKNGRLDIEDWFPPAESVAESASEIPSAVAVEPAAAQVTPWRVNLARFALDGLGIQFTDAGFASPLRAEIGNVQIGFVAQAEAGGAQTQAVVDDLGIDISGIRLHSGSSAQPLFVLGGIGSLKT